MANILDIRQIKINEGGCKDICNASFVRMCGERGHCFLCSGAIGGKRGFAAAYKHGETLLCEKCFHEYKEALSMKEAFE